MSGHAVKLLVREAAIGTGLGIACKCPNMPWSPYHVGMSVHTFAWFIILWVGDGLLARHSCIYMTATWIMAYRVSPPVFYSDRI